MCVEDPFSQIQSHLEISSDVEDYILGGETLRVKCQRLFNFLLVQLDNNINILSFSHLLNKISVLPWEFVGMSRAIITDVIVFCILSIY